MEVVELVAISKLAIWALIGLTGCGWLLIISMLGWYIKMTYAIQQRLVGRVGLLEKESVTWIKCDDLRDKCPWGKAAEEMRHDVTKHLIANGVVT